MMQKIIIKTLILLFITTPILSCTATYEMKELHAGRDYDRQSDYENAVKKYSEAIEKDPDYWKIYFYRGLAYQSTNEIDLAITDLSTALKLIPQIDKQYSKLPLDKWALIYMRRGTLYHKKNLYDLAINDFNHALELDPKCIGAYFYRGVTKEKIDELPAAVEDYSKTVSMMSKVFSGVFDSGKIMAFLHRANVYRKQNKLNLALADNNRAIEIDGTAEAFFSRGTTQIKMENFKKAISDFNKSIKINPSNENSYLYRASVRLITTCDLKKVLEDYYSVINIKSIDDDTRQLAYNQIAWILATAADDRIRDGEKALIYTRKSIEIKANCRNLDTLAVAFAECGKFENAANTHKNAVLLCKENNPELLTAIEKHLEYYELKKPIREECPGAEVEMEQLRKWQKGDLQ